VTLPLSKRRKFLYDLAERAGWAGLWAIVSVISVDQLGLPGQYVPIGIIVLSALKSLVAKHIGKSDSASTVTVV